MSLQENAVLSRNYAERLGEFVDLDGVTHRSGRRWTTAETAVEKFGKFPLYYVERGDNKVTHKGYISRISVEPHDDPEIVDILEDHVSDADTYDEYNDRLDTTTYLATEGERLEDPFHQSDLTLVSDGTSVSENLSRPLAYVKQRPGDFPDFP